MYHFKYYAIGHSYLKHGPFKGWQTDGYWGMAASKPENDYFHKFQDCLKDNFECKVSALAENHASYERLCVEGVTADVYKNSEYYKHMKDVITTFKPNIITVFVGGGNTVANDEKSLTMFFDVLFDMITRYTQPETVVIWACMNEYILKIGMPIIEKYNFIYADASFIHSDTSRENPYYAFKEYPEYDEAIADGAVEFRTHPNDLGHLKIAECIYDSAREEILKNIPECDENEELDFDGSFICEENGELKIYTEPKMSVNFNGFNVSSINDCVVLSSAHGTGASVSADNLDIDSKYNKFYIRLSIDGYVSGKELEFSYMSEGKSECMYCPIKDNEMNTYEFDISAVKKQINSFRISPNMEDCMIRVNKLGFVE